MTTENQVGMTHHQHLRSEAIYRINSVLASIVEDETKRSPSDRVFDTRTTQLQPTLFDPYSRKFRWLLVDRKDWHLNHELLSGLLCRFQKLENCDEKNEFIENCTEKLKYSDEDFQKQCKIFLCKIQDKTEGISEKDSIDALIAADEKQRRFHHAFMKILQERTFERTGYYDGLVLKLIEDRDIKTEGNVPLDWVSSTVAHGIQGFPLMDVVASYGGCQKNPFVYSQELGKKFRDLSSLREELESSKCQRSHDESWEVAIQEVVARNTRSDHIVSIPVFDGWAVRLPWGRLVGVVHVVGASEKMKGNAGEIAKRIREHEERIVAAFRTAALARIESEPATDEERRPRTGNRNPTLSHFLRTLPFMQDWESIKVCRVGDDNIDTWKRDRDDRLRRERVGQGDGECAGAGGKTMKTPVSLLNMIDASWLNSTERDTLENLFFEFEFPSYAIMPSETSAVERLERRYIQDQIDIWRIVLPKILLPNRIRREAIRTAATAIMSRNMSHNIGSHVLARYASKIGADNAFALNMADHRGEFLTYLQRRMDFLAEVATSDRAFWMQALSLQDQIDRLNYCTQQARLVTDAEPVLLRFITGKEDLKATVEYKSEDDAQFACPGGEVGVHALFVILENIIRNSARHGNNTGTRPGFVRLCVRLNSCGSTEHLLKVEIVDSGSTVADAAICKINRLFGESFLAADGQANSEAWGLREMQICAHYLRGFSLYDLEGYSDGGGQPVIKAGVEGDKLKYTIYLQRAKQLAAIVTPTTKGKLRMPNQHEATGVVVLEQSGHTPWDEIAKQVRGYDFVVVQTGVRVPTDAGLPIRTMELDEKEICDLVAAAACTSRGGSSWMEPLHRKWAELCRDSRPAWANKPLWGVAIEAGDALTTLGPPLPAPAFPGAVSGGGLVRARKGADAGQILPLPDDAIPWWKTLNNEEIAAAWVDHPVTDDFKLGGARLSHAYCIPPPRFQRRWISVEGAYSDSPHTLFLNDCGEHGWEAIAAAVPRVAVLDERVQSESQAILRGTPLSRLWRLMGVWMPQKDKCNLDEPEFVKCKVFLKDPTGGDCTEQYPVDYLVLHLTILERLATEKKKSMTDTLECLRSGGQASQASVILVTGRGVPAVARTVNGHGGGRIKGARYLPISALLESLVSRPSKLALMRTIWSAGRPDAIYC